MMDHAPDATQGAAAAAAHPRTGMNVHSEGGHLDSSHVFIRLYIYTHLARGEERRTDGVTTSLLLLGRPKMTGQ